jgi:hypothetical protein
VPVGESLGDLRGARKITRAAPAMASTRCMKLRVSCSASREYKKYSS